MYYKLIKKRIVEFDINRIIEEGFFNISYTSFFTDVDIIDPTQPGVQLDFVKRPQFYLNIYQISKLLLLAMHQVE